MNKLYWGLISETHLPGNRWAHSTSSFSSGTLSIHQGGTRPCCASEWIHQEAALSHSRVTWKMNMPQHMQRRPSFNKYCNTRLPPIRLHLHSELTIIFCCFMWYCCLFSWKVSPRAWCHFQVLPNPSLEYDITWYVSSSPCISCANTLAKILQQRKKVRLCVFCSRLFEWDQPEVVEALRTLVGAGCKLRMMKPSDFQHVWETYVEKEGESFTPWEDCQDNYNYYKEILADILK